MSIQWTLVSSQSCDPDSYGIINVDTYQHNKQTCLIATTESGTKRLFVQKPTPLSLEDVPEVDVTGLNPDQITVMLNRMSTEAIRFCAICRSAGTDANLGVALILRPTEITSEESQKQSDEAKAERSERVTVIPDTYFEPYPFAKKPTDSVTAPQSGNRRLVIEIVPDCYVCVCCRRNGEGGSSEDGHQMFNGTGYHTPRPDLRNIINKYGQRSAPTMVVSSGPELYSVTDRFSLATNTTQADLFELNWRQQMELLMRIEQVNSLESLRQSGQTEKYHTLLAAYIRHVIPTLMRSASDSMVKNGRVASDAFREMQDFEPTYAASLVFLRGALHFLQKYPVVRNLMAKSVYEWVGNPFSVEARSLFQTWQDVIWVACLANVPFAHIRHQLIMYMLNSMVQCYDPTEEKLASIDKITYLRRVFNEGRNTNNCRRVLYMLAFTGMISELIVSKGYGGLIGILDANSCYLPLEYLTKVWREMSLVNDQINSLEPYRICGLANARSSIPGGTDAGVYNPGFMRHIGMADPSADIPTAVEQIYKQLTWARTYAKLVTDKSVSTQVLTQIEAVLKAPIITSATTVHHNLVNSETERLQKLFDTHNCPTPLRPDGTYPRLTDKVCTHCERNFNSPRQLIAHIEEATRTKSTDPRFSFAEHHRTVYGCPSTFNADTKPYFSMEPVVDIATVPASDADGVFHCAVSNCICHNLSAKELRLHLGQYGIEPFFAEYKQAQVAAPEPVAEAPKEFNMWDSIGNCVICLDDASSEILFDCGHVCMCTNCAHGWLSKNKSCPICRSAVRTTLTIDMYRANADDRAVFVV